MEAAPPGGLFLFSVSIEVEGGLSASDPASLQLSDSRRFADCAGVGIEHLLQLQVGDCDPTGLARPCRGCSMPLFSFRTSNAGRASASDACELESPDEVWKELTGYAATSLPAIAAS
jgi:hypothetical protein